MSKRIKSPEYRQRMKLRRERRQKRRQFLREQRGALAKSSGSWSPKSLGIMTTMAALNGDHHIDPKKV